MRKWERIVAGALGAVMAFAAVPVLRVQKTVRADMDRAVSEVVFDGVALNATNFPDAAFLEKVKAYNTDGDQVLSAQEIAKVGNMQIENSGISDLTGIKYFTSLFSLYCASNSLTSLDVSGMTSLEVVDCSANPLTSLNVSGCDSLQLLLCAQNADLLELNVSGLAKLKELSLGDSGVKTLNASGCSKLDTITLGKQLETLNLSGCAALDWFDCQSLDKLKDVNVSGCTKIWVLYLFSPDLEKLDVSGCTDLKLLDCSKAKLTSLDVSTCSVLEELYCDYNLLTTLDLSANSETLHWLRCEGNLLTDLDVSDFEKLIHIDCSNNKLQTLELDGCKNLSELYCYENQLSILDLSGFSKLDTVSCRDNQLRVLDVSGCENLLSLTCQNNQLTTLKLTGCTSLEKLACCANQLERVNISDSPVLMTLVETRPKKEIEMQGVGKCLAYANGTYTQMIAFDEKTSFVTTAPLPVTVTFDANCGSGSMAPIEGVEDDIITLPECGFTAPVGYVFDQWDAGMPGEKIGVPSDMTIKAVWKAIDYTITVTTDGNGSASASAASAVMGTEITLSATSNSGYQFKEWQVVSGGVTITNPSSATTTFVVGVANVEIKAIFETIPTPEPQPVDPQPVKEPSFEDFIERMYVVALNRQSEPEGKAFWMDKVKNEGFTGGRVAIGFLIEAPEFLNRNLSDSDFIDVLYKTFFDREADEGGKAFWMGHLATDMTREQVVRGFIDSTEWCNLCAYYGVKSGAPNAKAEKPSNNALKFATRLYTECLGREPDADGLMFWALRLTNLESSGYEAAKGFFESQEFQNKGVDDETYVKLLYRTFMGRDYDQGGLEFWLGHLGTDMTRLQVLQGFAQSQEFTNICNEYGIDRGTI